MISFTAVVFSITVVILQLSSSQYSPRVLRRFLRDRLIQSSLGVFVATFAYAMVVLRAVQGGPGTGRATSCRGWRSPARSRWCWRAWRCSWPTSATW